MCDVNKVVYFTNVFSSRAEINNFCTAEQILSLHWHNETLWEIAETDILLTSSMQCSSVTITTSSTFFLHEYSLASQTPPLFGGEPEPRESELSQCS